MANKYQAKEFISEERVRIYDTDVQGVVHYAGYYRFFTDAFEQFSRKELGADFPIFSKGIWFVAVESNASYHKPARLGDKLRTHVSVELTGMKTMRLRFRIHKDASVICDGSIVLVSIDSKVWKAVRIPVDLVAKMKKKGYIA
ncbi:MAG: acyl-CoA thioesterase [Candidatus Micrarchaeaceae archaeon]